MERESKYIGGEFHYLPFFPLSFHAGLLWRSCSDYCFAHEAIIVSFMGKEFSVVLTNRVSFLEWEGEGEFFCAGVRN